MFDRFTDRSCRVLVLAQEEARLLNHNFIGTEHILLGLMHEGEGVAAQALEALGISLEEVRTMIEDTIGPAGEATIKSPPFTPRSKKVLELSLREALQLGHNYIGTEHMLLGLIREGEGLAAQALRILGADTARVREQVITVLSRYSGNPDGERSAVAGTAVEKRDVGVRAEDLLGWKDIAALTLEGPIMADSRKGRFLADGIEYETCSYEPRPLPEFSLAVAGAEVTREAFDEYSSQWQADAVPIEGLGDAATFSTAARSVRVLRGSLLFVVTVRDHPKIRKMAIAAARRVLANLDQRASPESKGLAESEGSPQSEGSPELSPG